MENKEQAFNKLIDEALPMLRAVANGILNNNSDVDEAVQIALVKVWKYLWKLKPETAFCRPGASIFHQ